MKGVNDLMGQLLCVFGVQGHLVDKYIIYQVNQSAVFLKKNRMGASS